MTTILETAPVFGLLLVPALAEVGLGVVVWRRARDRVHGRFLALSLFAHGGALSMAFLGIIVERLRFGLDPGTAGSIEQAGEIGLLTLGSLVPALDLGFALTFPTFVARLAKRKWLLALPFLPPAVLIGWLPTQVDVERLTWGADPTVLYRLRISDTGFMTFAVYDVAAVFMAALTASLVFWRRSRTAGAVDRRRLRFMLRAVSAPMLAATTLFIALYLAWFFGEPHVESLDGAGVSVLVVALCVLTVSVIPPLAMGYGVLRYRILDWDRNVRRSARFTLSYGLITGAFAVVFFGVAEAAEYLLQTGTRSAWVGLAGAGALAIGIQPLHRAATRFARRVVADRTGDERETRRREIYRAAFDDLSEDGLTPQERAALQALAESLQLGPETATAVERSGKGPTPSSRRSRRGAS